MTTTAAPSVNPSTDAQPRNRHTILVLDDERDVVQSVKDLLRLEYRVLTATTAEEAQEILNREDVHVVMTDQRMPTTTGVEFLRDVRDDFPDATRLLFTGYADIRAVIDAINQGNVYRYVTKPWDPEELQGVIREACERYELLVERRHLLKELKSKNAQLEEANAQLTQGSALKSAFIKVASHELRTPLTILLGLTNLAQRAPNTPPPTADLLRRVEGAGHRLQRLVDQLVNMLSAEQFDRVLHREPTDLSKLIADAIDDVRPFVELRNQTLSIDVPDALGTMDLDGMKIRDSLNHMLLNAIKFTPDGGTITVSASRPSVSDPLTIVISDTGCGIDKACLPRLFEPFFTSVDVSHHSSGHFEHNRQGIGLGLSIAHSFVRMHGGTIDVASEPGKGSSFTITLPG